MIGFRKNEKLFIAWPSPFNSSSPARPRISWRDTEQPRPKLLLLFECNIQFPSLCLTCWDSPLYLASYLCFEGEAPCFILYLTCSRVFAFSPSSPFQICWSPNVLLSTRNSSQQGVTKKCRLTLLTNSALVYESKCGGEGIAGSRPMSTASHITWHAAQNKLWISTSIFNLWFSETI